MQYCSACITFLVSVSEAVSKFRFKSWCEVRSIRITLLHCLLTRTVLNAVYWVMRSLLWPLLGAEAIEWISKTFTDESALLKHELAYCLGQMQDTQAIPVLTAVLKDTRQEPMVRHEAGEDAHLMETLRVRTSGEGAFLSTLCQNIQFNKTCLQQEENVFNGESSLKLVYLFFYNIALVASRWAAWELEAKNKNMFWEQQLE